MHLLGVGEFAPNSLIIDCLATFACHEEMATAVMFLFLTKSYKVLQPEKISKNLQKIGMKDLKMVVVSVISKAR